MIILLALLVLPLTSNWISGLFLSGSDKVGIEKMRSIFFQRSKSSDVPVTQPASCGGKGIEIIRANTILKNDSEINNSS